MQACKAMVIKVSKEEPPKLASEAVCIDQSLAKPLGLRCGRASHLGLQSHVGLRCDKASHLGWKSHVGLHCNKGSHLAYLSHVGLQHETKATWACIVVKLASWACKAM